MTVDYAPKLGDLSDATRESPRADLLAGSAGYRHFVEKLAQYISPDEALETRKKFTAGRRVFWLIVVGYILLYFGLNAMLGPLSLRLAALGNDILRGLLLIVVVVLVRWVAIGVAGQLLLPLAAWCFLPMAFIHSVDYWQGPMVFGLIALVLFACGWCIDLGVNPTGKYALVLRFMPWVGLLLFTILNILASLWITASPVPPVFSILAALAALLMLEIGRKDIGEGSDVDFLYAAAWKRWRFFITGRILAIIFGLIPFILFTSLLDHQGQLEAALEADKYPEVLRIPSKDDNWQAIFWRFEGRFVLQSDLEDPHASPHHDQPVIRALYLVGPSVATDPNSPDLPDSCKGGEPLKLPDFDTMWAIRDRILALNTQAMSREDFLNEMKHFEVLRITSACRILRQDASPGASNLVSLVFHDVGNGQGICFASGWDKDDKQFQFYSRHTIENLIKRYSVSKWISLAIGIFGFIFLWRRGGDSSLGRWIGLWLVGISLVTLMDSSMNTLPHMVHWFWQQSVIYGWNTFASAIQPIFNLFTIATGIVAMLWLLQISPAICWTYICWPTRIMPQFPPVVRTLTIVGKLAAVCFIQVVVFIMIVLPVSILFKGKLGASAQFTLFFASSTILFFAVGALLRFFTGARSEIPRLGIWPILAVLLLNLTAACYLPVMFEPDSADVTPWLMHLGTFFGGMFIVVMAYIILKRDFLRVRAVDGFTTLLLLLFVPFAINQAERIVPALLVGGPFFNEHGAEIVAILCVVLVFPTVHHWLHELLLLISLPRLRRIEHTVEHALEHIVDAETEADRLKMVTQLFETLRVPRYLLMSRAPKHLFTADINKLDREVPARIELSPALRHFLGKRRHFIDMHTMPFEWLFFFHQFELHRIADATACRYLLPVSVGESLRALILIPEGPGESVMANPAVSANINNFGIAAALSRPRA